MSQPNQPSPSITNPVNPPITTVPDQPNAPERRRFVRSLAATATAGAIATNTSTVLHAYAATATTPTGKLKVGQIGTVHAHAAGQMATMRKFKDLFDVVGVVEPDDDRRKRMANHPAYRGLKFMSQEQLLNTKGLQIVAVETDIKDLVPTAQQCVNADAHVFLDKPAGETLSTFRKLVESAKRKKRFIQMGYMFRCNPAFQLTFRAFKEGWLGELFEVHGVISKKVGDSTRKALARYPGGAMFELGCHLIDPAVYLMGKPKKVIAYSKRTRDDGLADNQLAVMEYDEATVTIRSAVVEVDGARRRQFSACGTQGTVDIKPLESPRMLMALEKAAGGFKKGYQDVRLPSSTGRYDGLWTDLAAIVRGEKQQVFGPDHNLAVHETILRASDLKVE